MQAQLPHTETRGVRESLVNEDDVFDKDYQKKLLDFKS